MPFQADPNISTSAEAPLLLAAMNDQVALKASLAENVEAATCGLLLDYKADPLKESNEGRKAYELVPGSQKLTDTLREAL